MKPILLIHGYSAESDTTTKKAVEAIYGVMPKTLKDRYGASNLFELNLSRYISLDDGITLDDISRALDNALKADYQHLLQNGFNVIIHSTGALVIRNWVRTYSAQPSPIDNIIHLAGANFGSGWAHLGKGQIAKWGRLAQHKQRGVRVLNALELGSDWTLDLHLSFLKNDMLKKYKIKEHVLIGSQVDAPFIEAPIRYAKEDGSDGVVRVAASNLNFNHVTFSPSKEAEDLKWSRIKQIACKDREKSDYRMSELYEVHTSIPGKYGRPVVPFAIPYECAHSGNIGIVRKDPNPEVMDLIDITLNTTSASTNAVQSAYEERTRKTYEKVKANLKPGWLAKRFWDGRQQYDKHAQIIFRLRDQDNRPIEIGHSDIFFKSDGKVSIASLIEDKHVNGISQNIITFYLRLETFNDELKDWENSVAEIGNLSLRINVVEPGSDEIEYVPLEKKFSNLQLTDILSPHTTSIIDVILWRAPSEKVYKIVKK